MIYILIAILGTCLLISYLLYRIAKNQRQLSINDIKFYEYLIEYLGDDE